jgi:hypothetical protein
MSKIKDLDKKVRAVLADDEKSRNSDIRLTQMIWWRYYQHNIKMIDDKPYVNMLDLFDLPREDNIKRIRAKIQNEEKLYLPTIPAIAKKRGWQEDEWRMYLGKALAGVDYQTL